MKKAVFASIALVIAACLVAGLFFWAEIAYRAFGFRPSLGPLIDAALFPYAPYTVSSHARNYRSVDGDDLIGRYFPAVKECVGEDGSAVRFNSLGFRGPEFPPTGSKQDNEIRILITGGSASVSWNIGERCSLDALLTERLEAMMPGRKVRVLNLGGAAWKSAQELIAIQLYGLELDPDMVIHFSGFNDSYHSHSMAVNHPYSGWMVNHSFQRYVSWLHGTPSEFLSQFHIGSAIRSWLSTKPTVLSGAAQAPALPVFPEKAVQPEPGKVDTRLDLPLDLDAIARREDFDPHGRKVVDNYLKHERLMARSLTTKGAVLLSALQPNLYLKEPLSESEDRMMRQFFAGSVNFTVQAYLRLRQGLTQIAGDEPNVKFVDLSTPFNGRPETFFGDNVHFTREGYRIVADRLSPQIVEILTARGK
ncbi:hypothetical protein MTBLM5_30005 [Magnetospirillum sp. LM-5]|uniref:hypothetical protein n=1 Tax=Magnetospirillum sp. LM-5 TaxID=2681466 RepID=UPI00137C7E61|nr:hypothetical protein [Magnetospirillum sp. LM-5]CAA7619072.1 hypothetical protein MTBLM5_30005 [Magnetospirillum sp. LM-5]